MATWRASARPSASSRRVRGLAPAASRETLLGRRSSGRRLHALVDPLAPVLPGLVELLPVHRAGVDPEYLAAEALDRLDLDPLGATQSTGRLHRPHIAFQRLALGELLQLLDASLGGMGLERGQ
jgi:hypothetical protein